MEQTLRSIQESLKDSKDGKGVAREIDYSLTFMQETLGNQWYKDRSFSPGRYAVGFPFMHALFNILEKSRPSNILEYGLGQSTKMLIQYAKEHDFSRVETVEHDIEWKKFCNFSFPDNHILEILPLKETVVCGYNTLVYDEPLTPYEYDLVIADGPFGQRKMSRAQILDVPLKKDFTIMIDDYGRKGEQQTVRILLERFDNQNIKYYKSMVNGIKKTLIISTNNFLTSL